MSVVLVVALQPFRGRRVWRFAQLVGDGEPGEGGVEGCQACGQPLRVGGIGQECVVGVRADGRVSGPESHGAAGGS